MSHNPLVTIIIPTFQRPHLLRRALESAVNQTYSLFQVQIYDNASGDETSKIAHDFVKQSSNVKYHCHSKNMGMIQNYAYALKNVNTPYFSFLSDDDLLFPWYLEVVMQGFQTVPEAGFSAGSTLIISENNQVIRAPFDLWKREGRFAKGKGVLEMIGKYPIPTNVLFNHHVIKDISIDEKNPLIWDCDFLLQIAAHHPVYISKRPCGIFRHHADSFSKNQTFKNWANAFEMLISKIENDAFFPDDIKSSSLQLIKKDFKLVNRAHIVVAFSNKNLEMARENIKLYKNRGSIIYIISLICLKFYPLFSFLKFIRNLLKKDTNFNNYAEYNKYL